MHRSRLNRQNSRQQAATLDAFANPGVLPLDGVLCIANVQAVVRALGRAVGMSPSDTFQFIVSASELTGSVFEKSPREGRVLLRFLRKKKSVGMEIALEWQNELGQEAHAAKRWETSTQAGGLW